jgi:hypothetical protein
MPADLLAALLLALALLAAVGRPAMLDALDRRLVRALRAPLRPWRWALGLALAALLGQVVIALWIGAPVPRIHDEHSLLLQADTFANGRLTNPPPALWRHFETFHVIVQPTYAAKYPPAQGAVLAAGVVLGHPALGVWLSGSLLCAVGAWAFAAWLRPPRARLAGLLLMLTVVLATTWSAGYRGGFVAATAGSLLFGAAARLRWREVRRRDGLVFGAALGLLALSRPWEGLFVAVAAAAPLALDGWRRPERGRGLLLRALPPATLAACATLAFLAFYHWRVTGDPLTFPYQVHDERYTRVPLFLWEELRDPAPANPQMDTFFREFEAEAWVRQHTVGGWLGASADKLKKLARFYLPTVLLPALFAVPLAVRRPRPRWAAGALLLLLASQLIILPSEDHYVAAGTALVFVLLTEGWRRLRRWRFAGAPLGRRLAAALPVALLLLVPARAVELRPEPDDWALARADLRRRLEALPGKDLVLVRYDPRHSPHAEWVYNGADLGGTEVLWARSLSPAEDCALAAAEPGRRPWALTVVEALTPPRLEPLPRDACAGLQLP